MLPSSDISVAWNITMQWNLLSFKLTFHEIIKVFHIHIFMELEKYWNNAKLSFYIYIFTYFSFTTVSYTQNIPSMATNFPIYFMFYCYPGFLQLDSKYSTFFSIPPNRILPNSFLVFICTLFMCKFFFYFLC